MSWINIFSALAKKTQAKRIKQQISKSVYESKWKVINDEYESRLSLISQFNLWEVFKNYKKMLKNQPTS